MTTNKAVKKTIINKLALKKVAQSPGDALSLVNNDLQKAFANLSNLLSTLTVNELPPVFSMTKKYATLADDVKEAMRNKVLAYVLEHGEQKTEKGTRVAFLGGYAMEVQPAKTGTDPKKLEALLRAKGREPELAMDAKISYVANDGKVADAVKRGDLTQGEVDACRYDASYRVMEPQKTNE